MKTTLFASIKIDSVMQTQIKTTIFTWVTIILIVTTAYQHRKRVSRSILLIRRYRKASELLQKRKVYLPSPPHNGHLEVAIWPAFPHSSIQPLYRSKALFHRQSTIHFPFLACVICRRETKSWNAKAWKTQKCWSFDDLFFDRARTSDFGGKTHQKSITPAVQSQLANVNR